jgi:hypothetical protein
MEFRDESIIIITTMSVLVRLTQQEIESKKPSGEL